MGQQNSRRAAASECQCDCTLERRRYECSPPHTSSVHRYVSALTSRLNPRSHPCRHKPCLCTEYNNERLPVVLTHLRRELDAFVFNAEESKENEVYVLSVAPRNGDEDAQEAGRSDSPGNGERLTHIQVVCGSELRALLLQQRPTPPLTPPPVAPPHRVHTQVDYLHCLVPDLQEITACSFYWGKMDRYEAERLLDNKPEGTFLLRDSAQEEHLFSVSFRKYGRSLHARIEHFEHKFSFDSHDPAVFCANTVTGLIEHYKDPSCVMFFEPMLTAPLPRQQAFSLQQLARAAIVSHTTYDGVESLPLPPRLRSYLKEYHYRQRIRVRNFDADEGARTYAHVHT